MHSLSQLRSGELNGISQLSLSENLKSFPLEILTLANSLEVLDLSNNALRTLPEELVKLTKLKIIFASYNQFDHLPEVLGKLPNLEMIGFRANKIKQVSEKSLPIKLRWLTLTDNLIEKLPNSLGERPRLQKLMLSGNRLRQLPTTLNQAHNLELVRISANKLTECPDHLLDLPKLAWLAFAGNPFSETKGDMQLDKVPELSSNSFNLGEVLGQGASGIIYKASWNTPQREFPQDIAVKVFKGGITSDGYPQDELNACLQTGCHPNLVSSLAQVNEEKHLALIMNLIPAHYKNLGLPPSLQSCTRDTFSTDFSLSIEVINKIVIQMDNVFEHLHNNYVCHGDIYAHNTLFNNSEGDLKEGNGAQGDIIFGDFGAASCYQMLTVAQQEKIKRVEHRALINFIEDLLSICVKTDINTKMYAQLKKRVTI